MSSPPKNILLVTRPLGPPWNEGSKNFARELAARIEGFNFHLLTCEKTGLDRKNIVEHPIYSSPDLRLSLVQKARLLRFLLNPPFEIDVMHFLFTPSPTTSSIIKKIILPRLKLKRSRPLKTIQTAATLDFKRINKENVSRHLFADRIITYSQYSRDFLRGLEVKNVSCIYPGVDLKRFRLREKDKQDLGRLKLKTEDKIIVYTGEYVRLKAADMVLSALPLIIKEYPSVKLIFACRFKSSKDIAKKRELEQKLSEMRLENKVLFLEPMPSFLPVEKFYNLADVFIYPAKEMTGKFDIALMVLEALASGLPAVISDIKPLNEVFKSPDTALALKKKTPEELARKVLAILQNKELESKLRNGARTNIERNFNIAKSVKAYQELYREIT